MGFTIGEWIIIGFCLLVIVVSQQVAWMKGWFLAWHERRLALKDEGKVGFFNLRTRRELIYDYGFQFLPLMMFCYIVAGDSIVALIATYFGLTVVLTGIETKFARTPPHK